MKRTLIPLCTFLLLLGCGGSEPVDEAFMAACAEVPGCEEGGFELPADTEMILRVFVVRDAAGQIRIDRAEPIEVIEGTGVPLGRLAGSHMLVGFDRNDNAVDAQLIGFPSVLRGESAGDWSEDLEIDLTDREVDAIGYVRAEIGVVRLAVVDQEGREVAALDAPSTLAGTTGWLPPELRTASFIPTPVPQPRQLEGVPPHCAHVQILQGEDDRDLARGVAYENEIELLTPGSRQKAVIRGALGMMTPLLCHGLSRIVLGSIKKSGSTTGTTKQLSTGDMVLINVDNDLVSFREEELEVEKNRLWMQFILMHEAGHDAEALLNTEGRKPEEFKGKWPLASREIANETIARVRMKDNLRLEWQRTHYSFVHNDLALGYPPASDDTSLVAIFKRSAVQNRSRKEVAEGGFMSRYSGTWYNDDIADMVAWTYMGGPFFEGGIPPGKQRDLAREDFACQEMQSATEMGLPGRLAAVYTKLLYLKDLGMVRAEDVKACTGDHLGLPVEQPGFHVWEGSTKLRSFEHELEASIGTKQGRRIFQMQAKGETIFDDKTYPATVRLQLNLAPESMPLEEVSWPRGYYELYNDGINNYTVRLDGAPAGNHIVFEGSVVVVEASRERIVGSVYMYVVLRPNAPFSVPQTFYPPLTIRFMIKGSNSK